MHSPTLICLLALSSSVLSTARLIEGATKAGFEGLLKEHDLLLATWTSRSYEALDPFHDVFEQAADAVKTPCVMIDCDDEPGLCLENDINEYPALRLYKRRTIEEDDGDESEVEDEPKMEMTRYRGKRTKNAIRSFVTKHELPVVSHVTPSSLEELKKVDDIVIMAYLRPDQEALLGTFRSVAEKHQGDFVFGYSTDMAAADAQGLAMPAVVCYKNTDGDDKVMNGHFKEEDVEAFLMTATQNVIADFSERNMDAFMAPSKLAAYIFAATDDEAIALRRELTATAKRFEKLVTFGVADAIEYGPMAKNFGLLEDKFPALAIHAPMNDNVFVYRQGRKVQASTVEAMLTTILQAKATSGQVFGDDAPELEGPQANEHDEL